MAQPRIIIVGGGFGGLAAAKNLRKTPAQVILIDRTNHHLFQPLLYQVATAVLAPGQIATPIRSILRNQKNTAVILGEVTGVDKEGKCVLVSNADRERVPIAYDYLILASGATHSYFGHNEFEEFAPGLKSLADAVSSRNKILQAFEQAEAEEDPSRHRDLLTFVLVGAGPTGVEMAGALAVLVRTTLKSEYRRIDPASARIVLVDMAPRVLSPFSEDLSEAAKRRLERLGVEVRLGHSVDRIDNDGVMVGGERIASKTVIWTAGVSPSPAGKWLKVETDRAGRVRIQKDLTVPGHSEILVVGDTAAFDQDGKPLPGVAQVAMQQGRYAGKLIHRRITNGAPPGPFRYFDKGTMAVVGKNFAVLQSHKVRVSGFGAWLTWAAVHLQFLATSSLRLTVFLQWVWTYLTGQRGSRLIVNHHGPQPVKAAEDVSIKPRILIKNKIGENHMAKQIEKIAIVGTGVIGASWAALYLARGFKVTATDPAPNAEANLRRYIDAAWKDLTVIGLSPNASREHLQFTGDMKKALSDADFVQENGPERQDFKIKLFADIDAATPQDSIIASSSSGLTMSVIQSGCKHPERCVIGHPFNPPHVIPLCEVVAGAKTSPQTVQQAISFYTSIGKKPIHVRKEVVGHVANRLQAALYREIVYLIEQGVLDVADADAAVCWGPGLRWGVMGPNLLFHLGGGQGGIQHFMEHLSGPVATWWKDLGKITEFSPQVKQTIIEGVQNEAGNRSIEELERERDAMLLELLTTRAKGEKAAEAAMMRDERQDRIA